MPVPSRVLLAICWPHPVSNKHFTFIIVPWYDINTQWITVCGSNFYVQQTQQKAGGGSPLKLVLCVFFSMVAFTPGLEMLVLYMGAFPLWFNVSVHTTITLRFGFDGKESEYINWSCTFDMFLLSWPALSSRTLVALLVLSWIVLEIP